MKQHGLKHQYRQKRILSFAERSERKIQFPVQNHIQTIGIVADFDFKSDFITQYFGSNVKMDVLLLNNEKRPKQDQNETIFLSDLDFWGIPPIKLIQPFVDKPFDILINFTSQQFDPVEYICARSKARFKISKYQYLTIYDLIINHPDIAINEYFKEIIKTLNNFSN